MAVLSEQLRIDYAPPAVRRGRSPDRPLHVSLVCGVTPALLGTLIISLWLLTRANVLQVLGLFNIVLGLFCTLGGAFALLWYVWGSLEQRRRPVRHWLLRSALAATLLVGNFPLCGFYMRLASMHTVRVVNATGATVDSFVVTDPRGGQWELGPIPAGGRARRMIDAKGEGSIIFRAKSKGATTTTGVVADYITSGQTGSTRTVTLQPGGTHTVR